ncbi:MAG: 50S ribosomal protein L3 [Treponema sp.]|jgi:large subunit ribosomal protein L3|nr:50S ribosomal protein L3 [Treponema sp.]
MLTLMARKIGMTQVFDTAGNLIPVTVVQINPNVVIAKREGGAFLLGVDDLKKHIKKPYAGQFSEGIIPKRYLKEVRDIARELQVGDSLGIEVFEGCRYVDVTGTSKGKGFQGVVKRWGFGGGRKSHGSKFHREPGSTGQSTYPSKSFKNVKMPGRMGREQVTVLNLKVEQIDTEQKCLLIRGAVPGINNGLLSVRKAVKK